MLPPPSYELHHAPGVRAGERYLISCFFFTDTEKARKADHLLAKSLVLPSSPSNILTYTLTCKCWRHQVETELSSSTFMVNICTRRPSPCSLSHHPKLWHGHVCCSEGEQPFTLPPASKQDRWQSCGRPWMSQHRGKDRSVPRKSCFSPVHLLGCASAWLWSRQRSLVGEQCWWGHFQLWLWAMWLWEMPSQLPKPAGEGKGAAMSLAGRRQVQEGEVPNAARGGQPCRKDLCIQGMPRQTWANTALWLGMSQNWELGYIRKSGLQLKLCLLQAGTELEWCPVVGPLLKRDVEELEGVQRQASKGTQWCEKQLREWAGLLWQRGASGCSTSSLPSSRGRLQRGWKPAPLRTATLPAEQQQPRTAWDSLPTGLQVPILGASHTATSSLGFSGSVLLSRGTQAAWNQNSIDWEARNSRAGSSHTACCRAERCAGLL